MFQVEVLQKSSQLIHRIVTLVQNQDKFYATYVYAANEKEKRRELWSDLCQLKQGIIGPWLILGDFNCCLELNEKLGGNDLDWKAMDEFRQCVNQCELQDMKFVGSFYTWDNKQYQADRIWCKLDRNLVNADWISKWPHLETDFFTSSVSDHSPTLIRRGSQITKTAGNFKFLNLCTQSNVFKEEVQKIWSTEVRGHGMYRVAAKLALLKKPLKGINNSEFSGIVEREKQSRQILEETQSKLRQNPQDLALQQEEKRSLQNT
ncbi:hypothetical protein RIF29_00221 [Crotalaria pallida]|uniref:Endonuclease/exonuclease/phosphatase domain-containing protein n=1 Tax=Crotalaria pallida TaxID=3830 RepID=A0AAN9P6X2_CROPI